MSEKKKLTVYLKNTTKKICEAVYHTFPKQIHYHNSTLRKVSKNQVECLDIYKLMSRQHNDLAQIYITGRLHALIEIRRSYH